MSTRSIDGRPWVKLSELKPGDKVILDGGFEYRECGLSAGTVREVKEDLVGLYIECSAGHHHLDGQLSSVDEDSLVGMWRYEE